MWLSTMSKSLCLFLLLGSYYVSPHEEVMSFTYFIQWWMAPFNWMESNGFPVVWKARLLCFRSQRESKNKLIEATILKLKGMQQGQRLRCEITVCVLKKLSTDNSIQSYFLFQHSLYFFLTGRRGVCVRVYIYIYTYIWLFCPVLASLNE